MSVEFGHESLSFAAARPDGRLLTPPLFGRDDVLAALTEAREASTIAGRAVVLAGDAGVGKTAVLRSFLQRSRHAGVAVVDGSCVEVERRRPFGPFIELLASCSRVFGAAVESIVHVQRLELGPLRNSMSQPDSSITPGEERHRTYASVLRLIDGLARLRPMVLAIEDLHWADEASLELFAYLSRRLQNRPVLLIGTYRSDEFDRRHPLRSVLADLMSSRVMSELTITRLDGRATADLAGAMLGIVTPPPRSFGEFVALLGEKCEGNALFIEETVRSLVQSGALEYGDGHWSCQRTRVTQTVPRSIADGVLARVARLSPAAQRVLMAASVIGDRCDIDLLAAMLELPASAVAAMIVEARDAGLLVEVDGQLRFRHALTREAVRGQLLTWERRALHRRIGQELERIGADADALAYHFDESGDIERARRYSERAAIVAMKATAFAIAARHFQRTIELTPIEDPRLADLHVELADCLVLSGQPALAERAATAAIEASARSGDVRANVRARLSLGLVYQDRGDMSAAAATQARLMDILEPLGPSTELARVLISQGWLAVTRADSSEAQRCAMRAIAITEPLGASGELATALNCAGISLYQQARWAEGVERMRRARAVAEQAGSVRAARAAAENLIEGLLALGADADELRRHREELRAFEKAHGIRAQRPLSMEFDYLFVSGAWDDALQLRFELDEHARYDYSHVQMLAAAIAVARDGPDRAGARLGEARDGLAIANPPQAAFWHAISLVLAGRASDALASVEQMEDSPLPNWAGVPAFAGRAHLVGMIASAYDGQAARFRSLASIALRPRPPAVNLGLYEEQQAFAQAEVARANERLPEAIDAYRIAIGHSQRARWIDPGSAWLEALAHLRLAETHVQRSGHSTPEAQAAFDHSLRYWQNAGADWFLRKLREHGRELGLEVPQDPRRRRVVAPADPLTRRQREIALLVARGLTNREIAETLTLSTRTAESHVEQVCLRLGFHTRAQIATWVTERYGAVRPS